MMVATATAYGALTAWMTLGLFVVLRYLAHTVIETSGAGTAFVTAALTDVAVTTVVVSLDIGPVPPAMFFCVYLLRWYRVHLARTTIRNTPTA